MKNNKKLKNKKASHTMRINRDNNLKEDLIENRNNTKVNNIEGSKEEINKIDLIEEGKTKSQGNKEINIIKTSGKPSSKPSLKEKAISKEILILVREMRKATEGSQINIEASLSMKTKTKINSRITNSISQDEAEIKDHSENKDSLLKENQDKTEITSRRKANSKILLDKSL